MSTVRSWTPTSTPVLIMSEAERLKLLARLIAEREPPFAVLCREWHKPRRRSPATGVRRTDGW